jgi:plasmid stabilization system protein ParE
MKEIVYSPDYREKIRGLHIYLDFQFGEEVRKKVFRNIDQKINTLQTFENLGASVRDLFGIDVDYRVIHVEKNYVFYYTDNERIYILNMFNEREDYMRKMFGINRTDQ